MIPAFCGNKTATEHRNDNNLSSFSWIAGSRAYTGFLINHRNNMRILNEKAPGSFEIFIAKTTNGKQLWHNFYGRPYYGVSYMLFDLGSPSYLGNAHCIYPFMNFFITRSERPVSLNMLIGAGISYVEKIFDPVYNYKNIAISTHINAFLRLGLECRIRISAPLHLSAGLSFSHISNGTYTKPNAGLNNIMTFAGASYSFGSEIPLEQTEYNVDKTWHYTVYLSGGMKTYTIYDNTKYTVSGLSFEISRSHLALTNFALTLDLFYDRSDYADLVRKEIATSKIQTIKPGFAAGYAFHLGNLSANVHFGRYLYAKKHDYGFIYQRLALRYMVADRINIHCGLKTHLGQADYIELAIGYRIK